VEISQIKSFLWHGYTLGYGPALITPAFLRLDPLFDPLRGDPAFHRDICGLPRRSLGEGGFGSFLDFSA
jgi:hypothetical protein